MGGEEPGRQRWVLGPSARGGAPTRRVTPASGAPSVPRPSEHVAGAAIAVRYTPRVGAVPPPPQASGEEAIFLVRMMAHAPRTATRRVFVIPPPMRRCWTYLELTIAVC